MRVWMDPDKMASMNIRAVDVYTALKQNNYLSALGSSKGNMVKVVLNANTDVQDVAGFENLVIKDEDGTLVRLKDIAKVELGAEDYDTDTRFEGKSATFIGIWPLPNANSLDVIKDIRKLLPEIERILPGSIKFKVNYDATDYIRNAIHEVIDTLKEEIGLGDHERTLLETAAILHDIGSFIRFDHHNIHSNYIIKNSEIFGLSRNDNKIVAEIAKYHKGSSVPQDDESYQMMSRPDRMTILKLTAIVRIADALDRGHIQKFNDFSIKIQQNTVVIHTKKSSNTILEKIALSEKSGMFESVFGYKVILL